MTGVRSLTHRCIALHPSLRKDVTHVSCKSRMGNPIPQSPFLSLPATRMTEHLFKMNSYSSYQNLIILGSLFVVSLIFVLCFVIFFIYINILINANLIFYMVLTGLDSYLSTIYSKRYLTNTCNPKKCSFESSSEIIA